MCAVLAPDPSKLANGDPACGGTSLARSPGTSAARVCRVAMTTAASAPGHRPDSRTVSASSSVPLASLRYAVVMSGMVRTLIFPAVYNNIHETVVASLNADVFLSISSELGATSNATVGQELRGALSALRPIDWRVVPASLVRERAAAWEAAGCTPQRFHMVSQWFTVAVGYSLLRAHEDARGMRYDVIVRTRTDLVMEQTISRGLAEFAALVPWRVWTLCVDMGLDLGLVGTDADSHARATSAYTSAVVCPGQDGFAIMPRAASDAYFRTLDQFDCTSTFSRRKLCLRQGARNATRTNFDCTGVSRQWCNVSANCCAPNSCECRLSQQLREHAVCLCMPLTNRHVRVWKTVTVSRPEKGSAGAAWLADSHNYQQPYRPVIGFPFLNSPLPLLDLNMSSNPPPLYGPKCCYRDERPSAASRR